MYRFFVRRLTFCLEVTGSFDECLSVANEKGWERKLPLIRSLSDIFFYRMPLLLIFTEARNPRCLWGRCGAAGCLKTCPGSPVCALVLTPSLLFFLLIFGLMLPGAHQSWPAAALSVQGWPSRCSSPGAPAHVCRALSVLVFRVPAQPGREWTLVLTCSILWQEGCQATSSWKHSLLGKGMSYFLACLLDPWPSD